MTAKTPAERLAALIERRKEAGLSRVANWLSEGAKAGITELAKHYGSKDKAVEAAVLAHLWAYRNPTHAYRATFSVDRGSKAFVLADPVAGTLEAEKPPERYRVTPPKTLRAALKMRNAVDAAEKAAKPQKPVSRPDVATKGSKGPSAPSVAVEAIKSMRRVGYGDLTRRSKGAK